MPLCDTAAQRRKARDPVTEQLFLHLNHASNGAVDYHSLPDCADDTDIVRRLHESGRLHAHRADAERHEKKEVQHIFHGSRVHHAVASLLDRKLTALRRLLKKECKAALLRTVRVEKLSLRLVKCPAHREALIFVDADHHRCGCRDRIVLLTALDPQRLQHLAAVHRVEKCREHEHRVETVLVDLGSGMSALAAGHGDLEQLARDRVTHDRERRLLRQSARAADQKDSLILGIEVEPAAPRYIFRHKLVRAVHAGLLVDRRNQLDRRMRDVVRVQNCKAVSDRDSVIAAERRSLGAHELSVLGQYKR